MAAVFIQSLCRADKFFEGRRECFFVEADRNVVVLKKADRNVCLTLFALANTAHATVGESPAFELDTRESISTTFSESAAFVLDTRDSIANTGGTNYTVSLNGSASGGLPPHAFRWDTDSNGVYGDRIGANASFPLASTGGTYPLGLEVIDGLGRRITKQGSVVVNKQPVVNQPLNAFPTPDPPANRLSGMKRNLSFCF